MGGVVLGGDYQGLGIVRSLVEFEEIDADGVPLVIKPAIKEHFIYATQVKGWSVHRRR